MRATVEPSASSVEEIANLAGVHGGVGVRARVYAYPSARGTRHEIVLEANGERAIIDVPRGESPRSLAERAMTIFADSVAVRG